MIQRQDYLYGLSTKQQLRLAIFQETQLSLVTLLSIIDGRPHKAHRLAWLYVYGYLPEGRLDHIDRIKDNNRIANLREAGQQCNRRNTGNPNNNTSGVKGVYWFNRDKVWRASIRINGKYIYLGRHNDFEEAVCHRFAAEQAEGWSGCDKSSPAYQYVMEMLRS